MLENESKTLTRRRAVQVGGTTVLTPSFISVAQADTQSGNVELDTTATVPASTTLEITLFEDTSGDGNADRLQTESIPTGTSTTQYDLLQSTTAQGDVLWMELTLETTDSSSTPSLDTATITIPETSTTATATAEDPASQPTEPETAFELWQNYYAFVSTVVLSFLAIGLWGRSLSVGAFVGYLAFAYIAIETGTPLFRQILYVTAVLVFVGMAFKVWRTEFGGE